MAAIPIISKLKLKVNEHILDIGCGDGKITVRLAAVVPQDEVMGIDSSSERINFARQRSHHLPRST